MQTRRLFCLAYGRYPVRERDGANRRPCCLIGNFSFPASDGISPMFRNDVRPSCPAGIRDGLVDKSGKSRGWALYKMSILWMDVAGPVDRYMIAGGSGPDISQWRWFSRRKPGRRRFLCGAVRIWAISRIGVARPPADRSGRDGGGNASHLRPRSKSWAISRIRRSGFCRIWRLPVTYRALPI